ncbi:MAG TPA: transposase, partial [Hydrogenophilus thermoluteolus]|nr:transposase [Hydrogenophilus thermoluteolus]
MAMRVETNPLEMAYAVLLEHGLEGAGEALRILVNEAAKIERSQFLGAAPYERSERRRDYANGYKPKTVLTRLGELTFQVPQVRCGDFYPSALEKGTRTDQAVHLALAEMYVQGVSTRRVIEVLQRLLGPEISLSTAQVSRAAARLDEGLAAWRERPLGEVPYLFLDARYEKVRLEGRIVDCAVLIAVGVDATGKRRVLGCTVATSEA